MIKKTGFTKRNVFIVLGILCICLLFGSCFDFQLSSTVYHGEFLLGQLCAAYGQYPATIAMSIGGTLLIYICEKRWKITTILSFFVAFLLEAMAVMMAIMDPLLYLKGMPIIAVIILALLILIAANWAMLIWVKDASKEDITTFIKIIVFVFLVQIIVINVIKIPWGRPRMRMIAMTPEANFQPWWVIGSELKDHLMAMGIASEEFKSFPSGHTGCATCMLLISVLPMLNEKGRGKETMLFWIGVIFAFGIGISRIFMGAHFLSDITIGFTVTFLIELVACRLFLYKV